MMDARAIVVTVCLIVPLLGESADLPSISLPRSSGRWLSQRVAVVASSEPVANSPGTFRALDAPLRCRLRGGKEESQTPSLQLPVLRNLLDFSTSLTNASSGRPNITYSQERMEWLKDAMKEMLENTTDVFKTSVKQLDLNESSEENVAMKERALEVITERVDNMDLALGLNNLGGFQPLVDCLKSNHSGVRWRAADAIAVSVQNYQNMQQIAVEYGALNLLTQMYANRSEESSTRYKALHALSALIKGNSTSELWFLFNNGLAMLRVDIQIGEIRIKRKATFVMSQLLKSNAMLRQAVVLVERGDKGKGVLPELVNLLILGGNTTDSQVFEFATSALLALSQDQDQEQAKMMREEFPGLVKVLKERQDMLLRDGAKSEDEDLQELTQLIDTLQAPPAK